MFATALAHDGPFSLRFPRGAAPSASTEPLEPIPVPSIVVHHRGRDLALFAVGKMVAVAMQAQEKLGAPRHLDDGGRRAIRQAARARAQRHRRAPSRGDHRRGRRRQRRLRVGGDRAAHRRRRRRCRSCGWASPIGSSSTARRPRCSGSSGSTPTASRPRRSRCCPRPRCSRADAGRDRAAPAMNQHRNSDTHSTARRAPGPTIPA